MKKLLLSLSTLLFSSFASFAAEQVVVFADVMNITSGSVQLPEGTSGVISFSAVKGEGSGTPIYANNGKCIRLFTSNVFTVKGVNEDIKIEKIVFETTGLAYNFNNCNVSSGEVKVDSSNNANAIWTGDPVSSIEFINAHSNQIRVVKMTVTYTGEASAIDAIGTDATEAPIEYYNMLGIRIQNPAAGQVVIRRQGNNVNKVLVR